MKSASSLSFVVSAFLIAASAFACSSSDSTPGVDTSDAGNGNNTSGGNNASGGPDTPILTSPNGDDDDDAGTTTDGGKKNTGDGGTASCAATTTQQDCATCCGKAHPTGYKTYNNAITACICDKNICQYSCSDSYCAQKNASADCVTCANDRISPNCNQPVSQACGADPDCVQFNQCLQTADCNSKQ